MRDSGRFPTYGGLTDGGLNDEHALAGRRRDRRLLLVTSSAHAADKKMIRI